ncbi:MAG: polysaccharide deacetylase family protein [Candidatus Limnocylindria bacterium]
MRRALAIAGALLLSVALPPSAADAGPLFTGGAGAASGGGTAPAPSQVTCTDTFGPAMAPPASVRTGQPGYHAAWYGQSGYPTLCMGSTATATVAFMNTGSLGWYGGQMGRAAYLGTWDPEPGRDEPSVLGGDGNAGSPATGWPSANRPATQPVAYVGPGQVAWFHFAVKAPGVVGVYRLALRPLIEGAQWMEDFGVFWYVIVKADDSSIPALPAPPPPPPPRTYFPAIVDGARVIRVNALMYHYVSWLPPNPDRFRVDLTVSPTDFEEHLAYLKANGYNAITMSELWWTLDTGGPLPQKPVLLSFDDGFADAYTVVLPLLRQYGMVGTFAITANLVGRPGYVTREQVRALADAGMEVQSHAVDHVSINKLSYASQVYQLCTSRRILMDWTGRDVRHFIYPAGDYVPTPSTALRNCGYLTAYLKSGGSIQSSNYMYELRRVRVRGQQGLEALLLALQQ